MNIDLPDKFRMDNLAEVKDEILHIYADVSIKRLMYDLTFALKGNKECYYCHKRVKKEKITLDHMYSQYVGGPTISNNMVPCCTHCNSTKGNLSTEDFEHYMTLNKLEAEDYRHFIYEQQYFIKKAGVYDLPDNWVTYENVSEFIVKVQLGQQYRGSKYFRIKKHYQEYGMVPKPILVDRNGFVLDGYISLMFAKEKQIKTLPIILVENAIVHF